MLNATSVHGDTGLCFTRTERIKRMTGDHPNHMATLHTRKRHGTEYAFQLRCSRSRRYFNATSDYYDDTMLSCCAGSSSLLVVVVCRILRAWWIRVCSGSIRLRAERIQALIMHNGRPVERYARIT